MSAQPTALGRIRTIALSPTAFLRIALLQVFVLWLIVGTGAAVRLTGSGLGCRHWPGCEKGAPLPSTSYHAFIEFGNRLVGAVTIIVTLLACVAARRTPGLSRGSKQLALWVFIGTLSQAPLGYLAVKSDLRWPVISAHLLLSFAILAGAAVLALAARGLQVGLIPPLVPVELRRLGIVFAVACLGLVLSGTIATAAGPHSGGGTEHIDRFWMLDAAVYLHATVVAIFGCTFLFSLGYLAANRARSPRLFGLAAAVLVLVLAQVGLGELQWRTHLPWGLVLVHVAIAGAVWVGIVALATLFRRPTADFAGRT